MGDLFLTDEELVEHGRAKPGEADDLFLADVDAPSQAPATAAQKGPAPPPESLAPGAPLHGGLTGDSDFAQGMGNAMNAQKGMARLMRTLGVLDDQDADRLLETIDADQRARRERGNAYGAGEFAGNVGAGVAGGILAAPVAAGMKGAATVGAIEGGISEANRTGDVLDTAKGAGLGAAFAVGGHALGSKLSAMRAARSGADDLIPPITPVVNQADDGLSDVARALRSQRSASGELDGLAIEFAEHEDAAAKAFNMLVTDEGNLGAKADAVRRAMAHSPPPDGGAVTDAAMNQLGDIQAMLADIPADVLRDAKAAGPVKTVLMRIDGAAERISASADPAAIAVELDAVKRSVGHLASGNNAYLKPKMRAAFKGLRDALEDPEVFGDAFVNDIQKPMNAAWVKFLDSSAPHRGILRGRHGATIRTGAGEGFETIDAAGTKQARQMFDGLDDVTDQSRQYVTEGMRSRADLAEQIRYSYGAPQELADSVANATRAQEAILSRAEPIAHGQRLAASFKADHGRAAQMGTGALGRVLEVPGATARAAMWAAGKTGPGVSVAASMDVAEHGGRASAQYSELLDAEKLTPADDLEPAMRGAMLEAVDSEALTAYPGLQTQLSGMLSGWLTGEAPTDSAVALMAYRLSNVPGLDWSALSESDE